MRRLLLPLLLVCFWSCAARAADRPYLFANSAAEEDEAQSWSVENWYRRAGPRRSLTVAPEYVFDPQDSLQAEFRRVLDDTAGNGHELEIEAKHLFTRIDRDGWGWGLVLAVDLERPRGGPWERSALSLSVPLTREFDDGRGQLHVNAGVAKPRGERRVLTGVLAGEHQIGPDTALFGEWAREPEGGLVHGGLRHWIRRGRLALDLAWQRVRRDELRGSGLVLGLAWYDL